MAPAAAPAAKAQKCTPAAKAQKRTAEVAQVTRGVFGETLLVAPPVQSILPPAREQPPVPTLVLPAPHAVARTAVLTSRYTIRKEGLRDEHLQRHRDWLTVQPKDKSAYGAARADPLVLYTEDEHTFSVPSAYGRARWGDVLPENDLSTPGERISVVCTGTPLEQQAPVLEAVSRQFCEPNRARCGIIKVPCGGGKTFIAIKTACTLGVKTLFTTHKELLLENIVDEIRLFAPGARIGVVQRDRCEIADCDFVVAMIQTILSRDYPPEMFASCGLLICDEAHHLAAPCFSLVCEKIHTRYILGLSATPRRKDGLDAALHWLLGPTIIEIKRIHTRVLCRMIRYTEGDRREIRYRNGVLGVARMINTLARDARRNAYLYRIIVNAVFRPVPLPRRRKVLAVSSRREHLESAHASLLEYARAALLLLRPELVQERIRCDDSIRNCTRLLDTQTDEQLFSIAFMIGGLSAEERSAGKEADVLLSTVQYIDEGFNVPRIDTVVYMIPFSGDVEQSGGRAMRLHPDKNIVQFVWIADGFSLFEGITWKVYHYYKQEDYQVTWEDATALEP